METWKNKNRNARPYAHFDERKDLRSVWHYITNPEKVKKHGFYPFISYQKKYYKYSKTTGKDLKTREICYAAHMDRYIYSYYSYLLNEIYNKKTTELNIHESAIAYRTNLNKNNIHFAKEAFDFIKSNKTCYILVGDFTHFFDNLNHRYLKKQLCSLMNVKSLPDDYYAVYKNITKHVKYPRELLLKLNGLKKNEVKALNLQPKVASKEEFKKLMESYHFKKAEGGIPQGSPISAVLSNIYMMEFDFHMKNIMTENQGLYMRYSDDFILIFPETSEEESRTNIENMIDYTSSIPGLQLEPEKTNLYIYENHTISKIINFKNGDKKIKSSLNYLGFNFDGKVVSIRQKTLSKYHYRMYRKARNIAKIRKNSKKRISEENLYELYSIKGAYKGKGNFLSYVNKAENVFGSNEAIHRGTSNHLQKIRKALNKNC